LYNITSRVDYCNVVLAESQRATTDKLQPSVAASHECCRPHHQQHTEVLTYLLVAKFFRF